MSYDVNGYEIRHIKGRGGRRSAYEVFTPAGELIREYQHEDTAAGAADRHHLESKITMKVRSCMCCRNQFESLWMGNRLCDKCKTK